MLLPQGAHVAFHQLQNTRLPTTEEYSYLFGNKLAYTHHMGLKKLAIIEIGKAKAGLLTVKHIQA